MRQNACKRASGDPGRPHCCRLICMFPFSLARRRRMARPRQKMKRVSKRSRLFIFLLTLVSVSLSVYSLFLFCNACAAAGGGATANSSRNLWVSGLSSTTRATDLKTLFSKYGKVRQARTVPRQRRRAENFSLTFFFFFYKFRAGCWSQGGD